MGPPGVHWADIWMGAMMQADICIVMMDAAYLRSEACVTEFLCSADADMQQAIVMCDSEELSDLKAFRPQDGANGCGRVIMALTSGRQLYLKGPQEAAHDIVKRYFSAL